MRLFSRWMFMVMLPVLLLIGCETVNELRNPPVPKTFEETLAITQGNITALRQLTAFTVRASGQDCINNPSTDLCTAAVKISEQTYEYRNVIDLVFDALLLVNGQVNDCKIEYGGLILPCQSTQDEILAGLITLRKLLPPGEG